MHITIDESKIREYKEVYTKDNGIIGIDTNPDGFVLTKVDRNGRKF